MFLVIGLMSYMFLFIIFLIVALGFTQFKGFTRREVKQSGWAAIKPNYWAAFAVSAIFSIIANIPSNLTAIRVEYRLPDILEEGYDQIGTLYEDAISQYSQQTLSYITSSRFFIFSVIALLVTIFIVNIANVGCSRFFVCSMRENASFGELFFGFRDGHFSNLCLVMFLKELFIFLWSLLFVIPGIIKNFQYSMVEYILAEHPDMHYKEAFRLSKEMTRGNKWRIFVFGISFIGWAILGLLFFGIGALFISPFINAAYANLYLRLKDNLSEEDRRMYFSSEEDVVDTEAEIYE